jgi:hypothetical protein
MMRLLGLLFVCVLMPMAGGCVVLGYAAAVIPGPGTKARYAGLAGQRVAIVAWVDRAASFDFGSLSSDVSMGVTNKLQVAADPKLKVEELTGTTLIDPRVVYRWQKNHPELENRSITEIAPKAAAALGCTRLVYVEVQPFSIYDPRTPILLKGDATATIRVAEISGDNIKVGYEEAGVSVGFPKNAGEGVPPTDSVTAQYVYKGTVDKLTTEVARRFFSQESDAE